MTLQHVIPSFRLSNVLTVFFLLMICRPCMSASTADLEPQGESSTECGINALYVLSQLDHHEFTLDQIRSALPASQGDGYSMSELIDAADKLGWKLEGRRLVPGHKSINGPVIAFLTDRKAGHFIVVRPVGTKGTLVQVFDAPLAPRIVDYSKLNQSTMWSNLIIRASEPWYKSYFRVSLLVVITAIATGLFAKWWLVLTRGWSWRRKSDPPVTSLTSDLL